MRGCAPAQLRVMTTWQLRNIATVWARKTMADHHAMIGHGCGVCVCMGRIITHVSTLPHARTLRYLLAVLLALLAFTLALTVRALSAAAGALRALLLRAWTFAVRALAVLAATLLAFTLAALASLAFASTRAVMRGISTSRT